MKHKVWHKKRIFTTVLAVLLLISILSIGLWQLVISQTTIESEEKETTTTTEFGEEEPNLGIVSPRRTMLTQP